jgi:hypothetical protein
MEPESSMPRSQQPVNETDPKSDKFHLSEKEIQKEVDKREKRDKPLYKKAERKSTV